MRVVLIGYYGMGNLGDELMLDGLRRQLAAASEVSEVTVFARHDYYASSPGTACLTTAGLDKIRRLRAIARADLVCWGGGTFIYDRVEPGGLAWIRRIQLLCKYLSKPFALMNIGVSPVTNREVAALAGQILSDAAYVSCRDPDSRQAASALFGGWQGMDLGGDLAAIPSQRLQPEGEGRRGGLRDISFSGVQGQDQAVAQHWGELLARIVAELKVRVHFLPAHVGIRDDNLFHHKVAAALPQGSWQIHDLGHPLDCLPILNRMDFHLGMRLHSVIAADLAGIPNAGIAYQPKVSSYLKKSAMLSEQRDLSLSAAFTPDDLMRIHRDYRRPDAFLEAEGRAAGRSVEMAIERFLR